MVDTLYPVNAVTGAPLYSARQGRQAMSAFLAGATATRPLGARSGVRPGTPSTTVTATSTTWTCQPFAGVLDGQAAVEAAPYLFAFDAVATGAVTAASASIARVDIMYVQVDDPAESDGSSVPAVTRKYLAGTVASTPPATPARSIVIAHINVPISGGGSPTVTWKAPYCAAAGGVVNFNTKAELDAVTTLPAHTRALVLADGIEYRYTGSAWVLHKQPKTLIRYRNTGGSAITWNTGFTTQTGFATAVFTDASAFTFDGTTFTCVRAGRYRFEASLVGAGTVAASKMIARWSKSSVAGIAQYTAASTADLATVVPSEVMDCVVGDTIVIQTAGTSMGLVAASAVPSYVTVTDA